MSVELRPLVLEDYQRIFELWESTEGIGLSSADQPEAIRVYLERNPGLSTAAVDQGRLVGAILCGHDGRRGYLHHLAVESGSRGQGIGRCLVERSLDLLRQAGISKCHLFIFNKNDSGRAFWSHLGFENRADIGLFSRTLE
jgi:putative acetyltransferase